MVDDAARPGRILVPPARAEGNPLADRLRRDGAAVVEFPTLTPAPPVDLEALDGAVGQAGRYDWILFSGSRSAARFLDRWREENPDDPEFPARIATLGSGARAAVRERGFDTAYHPPRHTADDVASAWPLAGSSRVLLVRAEGAGDELPRALAARRARVVSVAGYRMIVAAGPADAARLGDVGTVALANGSAARYLAEGLAIVGLGPDVLAGARVLAVGEATAGIARGLGFAVTDVAEGRIADLVELLRPR